MASKKILVLGSGMVARPCVEYLVRDPQNEVTVGCRTLSTAQNLISDLPRTKAISIDVSSAETLDQQLAAHNIVISLVPYVYHAGVIRSAIKNGTNVVTASYVSPAIQELDTAAKEAGIIVLNEVGVDPGVDHLYAIKKINEIHEKGGKVKEFYSYCGGLPAPECSDNPLKFKFSWSPRGALLSQNNSAVFFHEGKVVEIPAKNLMATAKPYQDINGYDFVAYPNRTIPSLSANYGLTWAEISQKMIGAENSSESALIIRVEELCDFNSETQSDRIISGLRWMGILSFEKATTAGRNLLDTLYQQLETLMSFQPGERDLVMLQHKFVVEWENGKTNVFTSTLELLGNPNGYSAMSLSVGITCGVATQLMLNGHRALNTPGILAPYSKEIRDPIREIVEREGVKMVEKQIS